MGGSIASNSDQIAQMLVNLLSGQARGAQQLSAGARTRHRTCAVMIQAGTSARRPLRGAAPFVLAGRGNLLGSAYARSAGLPCAPASGLDDIVADGVAHQRRRGVEVQFAVGGRAMRLDRL